MRYYDLDTPSLLVDLDRLERNIDRMAVAAKQNVKALRPHTKTHKTPEVAKMQLAAGATGITVAKLGEAEVMAAAGFQDIFVANELVGPHKVERLMELLRHVRVIVGVDSPTGASALGDAGKKAGIDVPVRIEVDTGMGRAGVRTVDAAVLFATLLAKMPGIELDGIFTHEGTCYRPDETERADNCATAATKMRVVADQLRAVGIAVECISVGSTPGAPYMMQESAISELRPGVYVFNDRMQVGLGAAEESCALTVLATVISRPDDTTAILDAGTKALSGDRAPEGSKHGMVLEDPAIVFDWASEEHGHLDLSATPFRPEIGHKLRIVPWHACATTNMHERLYAVRDEQVEAAWPIAARGRIQ
jgi:D-serine deaminase-like pyridoxal phosphate-dependent protein